jgi:hypothetical protein
MDIFKGADAVEVERRRGETRQRDMQWAQEFKARPDVTEHTDGSYDVANDLDLHEEEFLDGKLPVRLNKIEGNFSCRYQSLAVSDGFPREVHGNVKVYLSDMDIHDRVRSICRVPNGQTIVDFIHWNPATTVRQGRTR